MVVSYHVIFQGLGSGLSLPTCLTLLGDISTVRMRASLIMSNVTTNNIGCFFGLLVGKLLMSSDIDGQVKGGSKVDDAESSSSDAEEDNISKIVGCFAVPPLLFLVLSVTMPESPVFSAKKGDREGVVKALR